MNAAEFSELLRRRSIHSILPAPLPHRAIDEILDDARHVPSWSNTRPYCVAVASGEQLERLRERYRRITYRTHAQSAGTDDDVNQFRAEHPPVTGLPEKQPIATKIRVPQE